MKTVILVLSMRLIYTNYTGVNRGNTVKGETLAGDTMKYCETMASRWLPVNLREAPSHLKEQTFQIEKLGTEE
jgi:hypothetical protein